MSAEINSAIAEKKKARSLQKQNHCIVEKSRMGQPLIIGRRRRTAHSSTRGEKKAHFGLVPFDCSLSLSLYIVRLSLVHVLAKAIMVLIH
jgi:hypothetical protein